MHNIVQPKCSEKVLAKRFKSNKERSKKQDIENINNNGIDYPMKQESDSVQSMESWVKSFRAFKNNTRKSG